MSKRTDAANLVAQIQRDLGRLSAIVPRGPLLELVADEEEHMAALAEAIGAGMPLEPQP